jgi:surface polysaccharide O-acyltransferase-like enzyme
MITPRNAAFDALRVLCLLGIITLHVAGGGFAGMKPLGFVLDELSRFAVPVFFVLSAWFWKETELEQPMRLIAKVALRVLPAFVLWLSIILIADGLSSPEKALRPLAPGNLANTLWTGGPAFHLWFLPALVIGTAIVAVAARWIGWTWTTVLAVVLYLAGTAIGGYAHLFNGHGYPFWVDRNGVFFAPVFLVAGVLLRRNAKHVATIPMPLLVLATVASAALHVAEGFWVVGRYPMGHDYTISTLFYGLSVVALFSRLSVTSPIWSTLGRATFVAYLAHTLVLRVLVMNLHLGGNSLVVIGACFVVSLGIGVAWQASSGMLTSSARRVSRG